MDLKERALMGALGGAGGTLVLSGLREVLKQAGLVFDTSPVQVVDRVEELGLVRELSPGAHRALTASAHLRLRSRDGDGPGTVASAKWRTGGRSGRRLGAGGAGLGRGMG
ncbi:MAG: hypothetical protein ACR2GU_00525 [Rubrobacteraceae bacterium]